MDTILEEEKEYKGRKRKAESMMVYLFTFTVVMIFAGLTSAYVIRKESKDWVTFKLPDIYFISTALIIASSVFMIFVMNSVKKDKIGTAKIFMLISLILGIAFTISQYQGFWQLHEKGIYAMGPGANIGASFIVILTLTHVIHLVFAMLSLIWTFFKLNRGAYSSADFHGLKLCATFWHFMDILWVYLFLFLYFIR